jgi:hypothetical protein
MNYDVLVNKILTESYIGQGEHFKVDDHGAGKVIKRPIKGKTISPLELKKSQFMKDQENTGAFAKIYEITPGYIVAEKVDVELASKICWTFTGEYLDISGHESENDIDDDYVSDFISQEVLNPKSKFDWKWVMRLVKDNEGDPSWKTFNLCAKHLYNLYTKLSKINWPIKSLDLHSENIGFNSKKQLVVIDF